MAAEKAAWRERFRAARRALPAEARAAASAAVCARVLALPEIQAAGTVHAFWPLADEVDLRPALAVLRERGVVVALPVVAGPRRLVHRAFEGEGALRAGRWGTREPAPSAPDVRPAALDVVLVPGLAFGRDGSRLGYGGGFYDAFLAQTPALRVGVGGAASLVASVPTEPHDARLDAVVTDAEVVRVAGRGHP
ncbi:5-formyltetrahydrofolate cyclo-ligase [Rubrivirga litoralis]|uniref:5-formyltetrahydrofolate cyclo-ligase n=1 Tax=Rubrivirga litoralis TaxID=3075598 RepID=A0ABU3BMU6_9BACT|nr:5-formyltetrahydrofolate cyclo-ligase [Rubrivirga sp. F394]MDT0630611.1 5-formyltetrahydrofolate cyclo-ligase [Rubrivirga sp. F394]